HRDEGRCVRPDRGSAPRANGDQSGMAAIYACQRQRRPRAQRQPAGTPRVTQCDLLSSMIYARPVKEPPPLRVSGCECTVSRFFEDGEYRSGRNVQLGCAQTFLFGLASQLLVSTLGTPTWII